MIKGIGERIKGVKKMIKNLFHSNNRLNAMRKAPAMLFREFSEAETGCAPKCFSEWLKKHCSCKNIKLTIIGQGG